MKNQIAGMLIVMAIAVGLVAAGAGLTSLNVTAPIASTGGSSPTLSITPCSDGETYTFDSGTGTWTCGNAGHLIQDEAVDLAAEPTLNFTGAGVVCTDNPGNTRTDCTITGVAGSGVQLDLGNDDAIESTGITEINVDNDTNSIFTETPADQLLIDLSLNWPSADTADALSANGANCGAGNYPLGVDEFGAVEDCTAAGAGGGDSIEVEDGDNAGTFSTIDTTARFEDSADINFTLVDGGAGGPDDITATIRANAVALGTDTTGNYVATIVDSGNSTITVTNSGSETAAVTLDVIDVNCVNCLDETEIADIYVLVAGDVMTGNLDFDDGTADSPRVLFRVQAGTLWNLYAEDTDDDLQIEVNTASTETVDFINLGAGVVDVTVDGTITGTTAVAGPNVTSGTDPGHDHTGGSISGLDISSDTNLTCGTNCTLTDDDISIDDVFVLVAGDVMTGDLLLDNQSELRLGEPDGAGTEFIAIVAPATITANITCTLEDDSTPFDPCVSGAGGGDITAVGPGYATGAAFTDGLASVGTDLFIWEGTTVDTVELTISGPADPAVDQSFTFPDDQLADDDLIIANGAGTFEYKALPDCDGANINRLQYDTTGNAFTCDTDPVAAGEYAAASIDGDDVNSNIAGRSLTLTAGSPDTLDLDSEIYTDVKSFVLLDPSDTDDIESIWRPSNFSVTIISIYCETDAGTVTMDLQIDDGTPAAVNGSVITCTTSGVDDASLAGDTGLDADERLDLVITTVTTASRLSVMVEYTIND